MSHSQTKKITKFKSRHSEGHKKYYDDGCEIRPMTKGEAEIAAELDKLFDCQKERGKVGHTPHPRKILK